MFQQIYLLCRVAPRPCTPGILSVKEKVKLRLTTKDTPKTSWFVDFQQKGEIPLRFPQWRIELVEILRGNNTQVDI